MSFAKQLAHTNKQQTYIATLLQTTFQHSATLQIETIGINLYDAPFSKPLHHEISLRILALIFATLMIT